MALRDENVAASSFSDFNSHLNLDIVCVTITCKHTDLEIEIDRDRFITIDMSMFIKEKSDKNSSQLLQLPFV